MWSKRRKYIVHSTKVKTLKIIFKHDISLKRREDKLSYHSDRKFQDSYLFRLTVNIYNSLYFSVAFYAMLLAVRCIFSNGLL